jgi:dolichol-phosphate mannosyltransferase
MSVALSVVIPARNEAGSIGPTVRGIHEALVGANITHEIVVVDDGSTDNTWDVLIALALQVNTLP